MLIKCKSILRTKLTPECNDLLIKYLALMLKIESIQRQVKEQGYGSDHRPPDEPTWHPALTVQQKKTQIVHKPKVPAAAARYRREVVGYHQRASDAHEIPDSIVKDSNSKEDPVSDCKHPGLAYKTNSQHLPNPPPESNRHLSKAGFADRMLNKQIKEVQKAVSKFLLPSRSPRGSQDKSQTQELPQIYPLPGLARDKKHATICSNFDPSQTLSIRHRSPHLAPNPLSTVHSGYLFAGISQSGSSKEIKTGKNRKFKSNNSSLVFRELCDEASHTQTLQSNGKTVKQNQLADYFRERLVKVSDYYGSESQISPGKSQLAKHNSSQLSSEQMNPGLLIEHNQKILLTEEVQPKFQEALEGLETQLHQIGISDVSGVASLQLLLNFDGSLPKSTMITMQKSDSNINTTSSPSITQFSSPRYMASKSSANTTGKFVYMEKSFSVKGFAESYLRHMLLSDKSFALFSLNPSYYRLHTDKIAKFLDKVVSTHKLLELKSSTALHLCYKLAEEKSTYKRLLSVACARVKVDAADVDERSQTVMLSPFVGKTWPLDTIEAKMVSFLFFGYIPEFAGPQFEANKQTTKRLLEVKIRSLVYPKNIDPADFLELQEVMRAGNHDHSSTGGEEKQNAKALEKRLNSLIMHEEKHLQNSQRKFDVLKPSPGDFRSDWSNVLDQCVNKDLLRIEDKEFDNIFGGLSDLQNAKRLKEMKAINVKIPEVGLKPMGRVKELLIYQREMGKRDRSIRTFKEDSEQA